MKWTYIIKNKFLASGALLGLCLLVLISNYLDRNHTENVKQSISSLYEDRLVAEEYILQMMGGLYKMKELTIADTPDLTSKQRLGKLFLEIKSTSAAYQKTKFTEQETIKARELTEILEQLDLAQQNQMKINSITKALQILEDLSGIQLAESKEIMATAEKLYLTSKISSQFVFGIILIILLVLQALVFTSKTLITPNVKGSQNLN